MSLSVAVAGAGLIGRRHVEAIQGSGTAGLDCIVDPAETARDLAAVLSVPWFADLEAMLAARQPDAVIVATPNALHEAHGLACIRAGVPCLIEKPLAVDVASASRLVEAAEAAGVPLLVGHHRRHNPLIAAAKAVLESGRLGRVVAVHAQFWLYKPDDYFTTTWRREKGAGPVFLNLVHDVDLLRHLCGEIVTVRALESRRVRGHEVEDTAVIMLELANGALGTVTVSDTIVAPWSWELGSRENPAYPPTDQPCYLIGGTKGSLELPLGRLWLQEGQRSWWEPIATERLAVTLENPLVRQIRQLCAVVRGEEAPLVSGREGLRTLAVIEAVKRSAALGGAPCPLLEHP